MELRDELQAALGSGYTMGRELGGGGMSHVFLAEDTRLGRTVVVKVLPPEFAAGVSAERFEREIRVLARLQQANIVPLLTAGDMKGIPFYTMPYVEGHSLRERLASGTPMPVTEAVGILRDVARALSYAHAQGVIHRDIKPENVLLSHGAAEVTDFGIARAVSAARETHAEALTLVGTSIGTPAYMAPEQAAGDTNVDHRADIYALGVMAYEMLNGRTPFTGSAQEVMMAQVTAVPPRLTRDEVPAPLRDLVMRCLAKAPAARPQTADEVLAMLDQTATPEALDAINAPARRRTYMIAAAAVVVIAALAWFGTASMRRERWVRATAIPAMQGFAERGQGDSAWTFVSRAREAMPNDSALAATIASFTGKAVYTSVPDGAEISRAPAGDTSHWVRLGVTPTDTIQVPTRVGLYRAAKDGYHPVIGLHGGTPRQFLLMATSDPDSDMVIVNGGTFNTFLVGSDASPPLALKPFRMDRREVSNRQYQAFVDAGGYTRRDLWPATFTIDGRSIPWETAMRRFVDKTGRPGPSTWEGGRFGADAGDLPVGGVSWYEAMAYAKFAGKSLPTTYHWSRAANIRMARFVVPGSNFGGTGPSRGSAFAGVSQFGVFDMAGNVREWCANSAGDDLRFILGGGWSDAPYQFTDAYAQPAMERAAINGIRLVRYDSADTNVARASAPLVRAFRDYRKETAVSPVVLSGMKHIFDYDRGDLNGRVDSRDSTENWIVEHVSFAAAYGNERVQALILLPRRGTPPYQSAVVFPGSSAIGGAAGGEIRYTPFQFVAGSGRAYVLPILKSTWGRRDSLRTDVSDESIFWRDHVVMWVKDMRRTVDYLASRPDMDSARVAYIGHSWGANMAPIVLANEPRFKAALLYVAGLAMEGSRPEVDPLNYLPAVTLPTLMLNGRYDYFFPVETSQRPFFDKLGTPPDRKAWKVYDGGHDVPRTELIAETLRWLDQYLGPVR